VSRMGRVAAPAIFAAQQNLGPLRAPFATQGRSYNGALNQKGGKAGTFVALHELSAA